jgi:hypothetical protein
VDIVTSPQPPRQLWNRPTVAVRVARLPGADDTHDAAALPARAVSDRSGDRKRAWTGQVFATAAATAGIAGAAALSIILLGSAHAGSTAAAPVAGASMQAGAGCQVRYQVGSDVRGRFVVEVTLTNLGVRALPDWTLVFAFPGDQKVVQGRSTRWQQVGNEVRMRAPAPATPLSPSGSTVLGFTGTYRSGNPWPTAFTLNGSGCAYAVVDSTGHVRSTGTPGPQVRVTGTDATSPSAPTITESGPPPSPTTTSTPPPSTPSGDGNNGGHGKPSARASHR